MNETTKECIKRSIEYCEDRLKETNHSISLMTERLANMTYEKEELTLRIRELKEDLNEETTEI